MNVSDDRAAGRSRWVTLIAMTLASSMILVDQTSVPLAIPDAVSGLGGDIADGQWVLTANMLPLAALMVLGGRLGDIHGLRIVFLTGALVFSISSALAGAAQSDGWLIATRAVQGVGAALMMPTSVAIVNAVFPSEQKGRALGLLAGLSAFAAALGPVIGGALSSIDWRCVFLVNVPLAAVTVLLALRHTPRLEPDPSTPRHLDYPGVFTFGLGIAALVYGLGQGQSLGWGAATVIGSLGLGAASLAAFAIVEHRVSNPMIEFRLFRHLNFLAANISQFLAGVIELGLAYLLPYFLLIVIGFSPFVAGLALIPATVPIILAGPLAGRVFDRHGGRWALVGGFLALSASGLALAIAAPSQEYLYLIPGLLLQGIGLGIVLTVNDPTGLSAVPARDQGQAAGIINTTEQLGGAVGIAALSAILLGYYFDRLNGWLEGAGIHPDPATVDTWKGYIVEIQQKGLHHFQLPGNDETSHAVLRHVVDFHASANQLVFFSTAGIGLLGAVCCLILVRKADRVELGPVFGRRSRWHLANAGRTPGLTRVQDGSDER